MLKITKGVTSEYFHKHPHTDLIDFFPKLPMFQEFRTHLYNNCFIIWVYVYALFF